MGGPSIQGYEEWLLEHNNISPMIQRVGARLLVEGDGSSRRYYLEGAFTSISGIEFDRAHGYAQETEPCSDQSSSNSRIRST